MDNNLTTLPLRIGIDGRPLQGRRTGVGRYVFELCRQLDSLLPDATFFVYSQLPVDLPGSAQRWVLRLEPSDFWRKMKSVIWIKLRSHRLCREDHLDVYWGGALFLPRLHASVKTVVTVHDLNHRICPTSMGTTHLWAHRLFFGHDVRNADVVVVNSHGTASRLAQFGYRGADAVVTPAISPDFVPQSDETVDACKTKYGINVPYILAVATWEPRKNLELLIRTFIKMKRDGLLQSQKLVLAGGKGWKDDKLVDLLKRSGQQHVLPLGYVEDCDLKALYTGAELFVLPSLYEGYGIPVIEALACGARVVASDIPEIREAGGDAAVYVHPDEIGIKKGIIKALALPKLVPLINLPTWEEGADTLVQMFMLAK